MYCIYISTCFHILLYFCILIDFYTSLSDFKSFYWTQRAAHPHVRQLSPVSNAAHCCLRAAVFRRTLGRRYESLSGMHTIYE